MQALSEVLNQVVPGTNSSNVDPNSGAYCCLSCRQEIYRLELEVLGRVIRPLPACQCKIIKLEEEKRQREIDERRRYVRRVYGEGLIDEDLKGSSFDNFEQRNGTQKGFEAAYRFAHSFDEQEAGLYFYGPVGAGKSHLAAAIHNHLEAQGIASVYLDVTQLFGIAKSTFNGNSNKTDQDYIQAAIKAEMLTLDEIGLTPMTEYEYRIMFQILNGRKGKITNFTSNLDLDRLEHWFRVGKNNIKMDEDGRLFDRLIGNTRIIEMNAESYRKYKAKKRMNAS